MQNSFFELGMAPPPGVAFVQWADGSIRIRYAVKDVVPLREMLLGLAKQLTTQAIQKLEAERRAEIERQKMPMSRLETITKELHGLKAETIELEPFDPSKFERPTLTEEEAAQQARAESAEPMPNVTVSKVIRELSDA